MSAKVSGKQGKQPKAEDAAEPEIKVSKSRQVHAAKPGSRDADHGLLSTVLHSYYHIVFKCKVHIHLVVIPMLTPHLLPCL